jgi:hypothetical protein
MPIPRHATWNRSVRREVAVVKGIVAGVLVVTAFACRGPETGEVPPPGNSTRRGESITIAAAGDLCEAGDAVDGCAATADLVEQEKPDVVLVLGDARFQLRGVSFPEDQPI